MRKERLSNKEEFRCWVRGLLSEGIVTVTFTKKDGTERVMNCTMNSIHVPEDKQPKEGGTKQKSVEAQAVFDIDKQEWRSFRWVDVNRVQYTMGNYNTKGEYVSLVD